MCYTFKLWSNAKANHLPFSLSYVIYEQPEELLKYKINKKINKVHKIGTRESIIFESQIKRGSE